jgi:hypothetical protein
MFPDMLLGSICDTRLKSKMVKYSEEDMQHKTALAIKQSPGANAKLSGMWNKF